MLSGKNKDNYQLSKSKEKGDEVEMKANINNSTLASSFKDDDDELP